MSGIATKLAPLKLVLTCDFDIATTTASIFF